MNHGFIKVAAASPYVRVADTKANVSEIVRISAIAAQRGVKLIVFPELSLTGATCGDLFFHSTLLDGAEEGIFQLAAETAALDIVIVVGAPIRREGKLYNCAIALFAGEILGVSPKRTPSGINEARYFACAPEKCGTVKLGEMFYPFGTSMLFYCEALHEFNFACEFTSELSLTECASTSHARAGAAIICTLGATCEAVGAAELRRTLTAAQSRRTASAYILADAGYGESSTDLVFGGHGLIYEYGKKLAETLPFETSRECPITMSDVDACMLVGERQKLVGFHPIEVTAENYYSLSFDMRITENNLSRSISKTPFIPSENKSERFETVLSIQAHGLAKRLEHTGAKKAIIGVSGGLDSTLALIAATHAMDILGRGHSDIIAYTMPCFGTTPRTLKNAEALCRSLSVQLRTVDIKSSVRAHFADIGHDESVHDAVYENAQARERTQVLMDAANAEGGLVIGTGDMSELALGWATYNGDHMSMYGTNASVPKTLVREIVRYYGDSYGDEDLSAILCDIVDTPVSPELLPADGVGNIAQRTEDIVGPYELHDFFLYWFLRHGFSPDKLERMALYAFDGVFDRETVRRWLAVFMKRFFSQQFKRSCLPDGGRVGSVSVSPRDGLCMPSDAAWALWEMST